MWPQCLPSSFDSIQLMVWEEMLFKEFQDGRLAYQNRTILAILNLYVAPMPPIKFWLNPSYSLGGDGGHLGYQNRTILAILNLYVAPMPPIKFWHNLTWFERCRFKNLKMAPVAAFLDILRDHFSNSESLCHCDAFHQVLAQSNLRFGRRCLLKNFKMVAMGAILDIRTERFEQF